MQKIMIITWHDKKKPLWHLDLIKKELILEVDFLFMMKTEMGVEPEITAKMVREVLAERFREEVRSHDKIL